MIRKAKPCALVIFGASGDLAKRKLVPALYDLYRQNLLPDRFALLGVGRTEYDDTGFRNFMAESIRQYGESKPIVPNQVQDFARMWFYQAIDTAQASEYAIIKHRLLQLDKTLQLDHNFIYYLSTPPSLYEWIAKNLQVQGLHDPDNGPGWKRIVIEKPFGYDLASAQALNRNLQRAFHEEQIYRIDHYLGKETVQNILVFRFANGIFEPLWNRRYVHHIEITTAETIGIENRGRYYDQAGALRDMVQNHLLQIVGIIAMEPPARFDATSVRNETMKIFQSLQPLLPADIPSWVLRGQYTESTIQGVKVPGYREEANVAPNSRTETFVALKFFIDNWRWAGVPFYLRVGKRLPTRVTEAVIHFNKTPHQMFARYNPEPLSSNQLIIRVQPDEGILLKFALKLPGAGYKVKNVDMDFHYSDLANVYLPSAYERLLLDCLLGDATLYARADAVEACWEFIDPVLKYWQEHPETKIYGYPAGSWGPKEASLLFQPSNCDWRYPCRNLVNDGVYCEL